MRDKAVASLCKVGEAFPDAHLTEHFVPLIKRLAGGEWFTSRVSGARARAARAEGQPGTCAPIWDRLARAPALFPPFFPRARRPLARGGASKVSAPNPEVVSWPTPFTLLPSFPSCPLSCRPLPRRLPPRGSPPPRRAPAALHRPLQGRHPDGPPLGRLLPGQVRGLDGARAAQGRAAAGLPRAGQRRSGLGAAAGGGGVRAPGEEAEPGGLRGPRAAR